MWSSSTLGGGLFNFFSGERFVSPETNSACPVGGFSFWTELQGPEDVGDAIVASDADVAALDGRNAQADQIVWEACVILWILVGSLTTQQEIVTCCYLLRRLLGPWSPMVEDL